MITNGGIAGSHDHVANLSLPGVAERSVSLKGILVADCATAMPREDEYAGHALWRDDPALTLPTKRIMHISATVVGLMNYIGPVHGDRLLLIAPTCNRPVKP
ncbi:hypothetical protein ASE90_06095 [Sphingomonas sp. Leaf67]|nr:hypothetical protein ASE90_06095 [Sphingomonas sp. Leaf67]